MKLHIPHEVWQKMCGYVDECGYEISGLGKVTVTPQGFTVEDVAIFRQAVGSAHSDIETKALAEFQAERVKAGESMKDWVLWWHSHADMGVFFSGTDTDTIEKSTEFPYLVSLVVNKRHEHKARLDVYQPVHLMCDLEVELLTNGVNPYTEICKAEIAEKVTTTARRFFLPASQNLFPSKKKAKKERAAYWQKKHQLTTQLESLEARGLEDQADKIALVLSEHHYQGVLAGWDIAPTIDDSSIYSIRQGSKTDA